jgi:hypothetical protein
MRNCSPILGLCVKIPLPLQTDFFNSFPEDKLKVTHIIETETGIEYMFIRWSQNLSQLNLVSLIKSAHLKRRFQPTVESVATK